MSHVYRLPTFAEDRSADETTSSSSRTAQQDLSILEGKTLLVDPNSRVADQTQVEPVEGDVIEAAESNTLDARPGQIIFFPPHPNLRPVQEHFKLLQKWEGYVLEVGQDTFRARLVPIEGEGPDLEAEVYIEETEEEDRALIEPGAVFYWSIGYLDRPSGRRRVSVIRFRRLPAWTERELEAAKIEAARLRRLLEDERAVRSTGTG